jgi:succinate-semialdehyde dehydrogenase/glutarate-semialdehyde dehydrogenase
MAGDVFRRMQLITAKKFQDRALLGGRWVDSSDGEEIEVRNPANNELLAHVPHCGPADAAMAIDAAAKVLPDWRAATAYDRSQLLRRLADAMLRDQDRLGRLMTEEQGKPLREAIGEVLYAAGFITWAAEEAKRVYGETIPSSSVNKRIMIMHQAIGVAAAITPWNYPCAMITRKIGPALAAGCTVLVKPATATPLSALAIGELAQEVGFPAGVLNILPGPGGPMAAAFLEDPRVRALSFTGSTEVGKQLMVQAATHVTRLGLELGGHAPFLVFDDADLEAAVAGVVASKFRNGGQTCICANRIYVQEGIYDSFAEALADSVLQLNVGDGLDPTTDIGPMIDDRAIAKVEDHVKDAVANGATIRVGGRRPPRPPGLADRFFEPTVIENVTNSMRVSYEETFGPIAPLIRFTSEAAGVAAANDTQFGLAAYFFTRDISRVIRVAEALEFGVVGANDGLPSTPQAPFGGFKASGLGREGGKWGMDEYLETKYVSLGISTSPGAIPAPARATSTPRPSAVQ